MQGDERVNQDKDLEKTWDMNATSGGARRNHSEKFSHIERHVSMHLTHGFNHVLACEDSVGIGWMTLKAARNLLAVQMPLLIFPEVISSRMRQHAL